jgi:hypothetical protein
MRKAVVGWNQSFNQLFEVSSLPNADYESDAMQPRAPRLPMFGLTSKDFSL